jgi:hypothetical protein
VVGGYSRSDDTLDVRRIEHPLADVWIGRIRQPTFDYAYGGTRMVAPDTDDTNVLATLHELAVTESLFKNLLINSAIESGALDAFGDRLPNGFARSRVGGARCIIRPRDNRVHGVWSDPNHPKFAESIRPVFAEIGSYLNDQGGYVKLTPDFGRYAALSDMLREITPHVLGIACEAGGCGGKTSYTTTGVTAAFEHFQIPLDTAVTLIGAAGAMGSQFLQYVTGRGYSDVAVSDIAYERAAAPALPPDGLRRIGAQRGFFTRDCLARPGVIVATTWGRELENSELSVLSSRAHLLLAHNLSVPSGRPGVELMRQAGGRQVTALPGQLLTLGGALTARLEWFWREDRPSQPFDKPLAHEVVSAVVSYLVGTALRYANSEGITPYEAILHLVHMSPN